ncbi:TCR/Tet family MFS transporter [Aliisedimentitalea scapharcae]|uniref:TCR/Tet family MFS transporter n=1 Tax=Aliisedimentitalea scapharcae TaxID=1524259 RepID=A0ABZ2XUV1_9RHOB
MRPALRLSVLFLLSTVMLDAMGIGLIMPIMPSLIREVQGGDLADAALWGGILSTVFAVMQFLFSPLLGNLSDRFGRRPVLLVSLTMMSCSYLVLAQATALWVLLVGQMISGITSATHATAGACMADQSKPHEKAANFGLLGAGFGVGFVLGPLVGGLLGELGTRAPFYAAAGVVGLNALLGAVAMRETLPPEKRRPFAWRRANPLGAFFGISKLPGIAPLLLVYFIYSVALYVYPAIWSYFTQARFDWSPQTIGLSLGLFGISMALVQGVLIRLVLRWVGERKTVIYGQLFDAVAFFLLAIVTSGAAALILTPVAALGAVVSPALQAIMSRRVSDDAQGELQGVFTSVHALSMIVSPLMMASVFSAFTRDGAPVHFPGAPFLVSMALIFVALAVFLRQPKEQS